MNTPFLILKKEEEEYLRVPRPSLGAKKKHVHEKLEVLFFHACNISLMRMPLMA